MSVKTVAIIQARMGSTRLPAKVLRPILGRPMLELLVERVRRCRRLDELWIATSDGEADAAIAAFCDGAGIPCYRGSEDDVLDRYYRCASLSKADVLVRLTGDCPLLDPQLIDHGLQFFEAAAPVYDYVGVPEGYPEGLDFEIFTYKALAEAWHEAVKGSDREHVTPFIWRQPERYSLARIPAHVRLSEDHSQMHWSVDQPEDFHLVSQVFAKLYPGNPDFAMADVLELFAREPALGEINRGFTGYEGYAKSLREDETER